MRFRPKNAGYIAQSYLTIHHIPQKTKFTRTFEVLRKKAHKRLDQQSKWVKNYQDCGCTGYIFTNVYQFCPEMTSVLRYQDCKYCYLSVSQLDCVYDCLSVHIVV